MATVEGLIGRLRERQREYLAGRPHRTFKLTKRRDIPKRVALPGYFSFTADVTKTLWRFRTTFGLFLVLYVLVTALLVGVAQQDQYTSLVAAIRTFGPDLLGGNMDKITETSALFGAAITGGLSAPLEPAQQINLLVIGLFSWLVVVWLLRQLLGGNAVKLRDGLYNAGAPFISTLCIVAVMVLQLAPAVAGILVYAVAANAGVLEGGVEAMAFALAAILLVILSLYWITSTFLAGIVVTLPGTYPWHALRAAGELAFGRRTVLLIRLGWLALVLLVLWAVVLIPLLLLDGMLDISWLPIIPVATQILGALSLLYATSYVYLLYRKMIDAEH